jgi:hypothetical protein
MEIKSLSDALPAQYFAWIKNIVRVERVLDGTHYIDCGFATFLNQEINLVQANAMLPGACTLHCNRARDHPCVHTLGTRYICGIIGVDNHLHMEVAIAYMADDAVGYTLTLNIFLGR